MDFFQSMIMGFQVALQPANLLMCFIGVLLGTLVGVLPGLGPVAAMSLLLPVTYVSTPGGDHHACPGSIMGPCTAVPPPPSC